MSSITARPSLLLSLCVFSLSLSAFGAAGKPPSIGVVFLNHGGFDEHSDRASWDATMQIFSYDPHSVVFQRVIWNPSAWPSLLRFGNAPKEGGKYAFEFERIGGRDPANSLTRLRYEQQCLPIS